MLIFPNWMNHDKPLAGEDGLLMFFTCFQFLDSKLQVHGCWMPWFVQTHAPKGLYIASSVGPAMSCCRLCSVCWSTSVTAQWLIQIGTGKQLGKVEIGGGTDPNQVSQ